MSDERTVHEQWDEVLERESVKGFRDSIPKVFSELSDEYMKNRAVEVRNRIKTVMKSLLAIMSTDTDYPEKKQNDNKSDRIMLRGNIGMATQECEEDIG